MLLEAVRVRMAVLRGMELEGSDFERACQDQGDLEAESLTWKEKMKAILRLLIVLALWAPSAHSLTLSDLRTEARTLSLDAGTSRQRFSNARVNAFINEGHRQAVLEARPILKSAELALVAGTTYYSLPTDFLQVSRITMEYDVLYETTPEALDKTNRWPETGARPTHYFINFASRTKVGFYPFPESSSSTGTVRYDYYAQATDMSADSDEPFGGAAELDVYHYAFAYYAAAKMCAIDGRTSLANLYLSEYRASVERLKVEAKSRPSYRPSAVGRRE